MTLGSSSFSYVIHLACFRGLFMEWRKAYRTVRLSPRSPVYSSMPTTIPERTKTKSTENIEQNRCAYI